MAERRAHLDSAHIGAMRSRKRARRARSSVPMSTAPLAETPGARSGIATRTCPLGHRGLPEQPRLDEGDEQLV